VFSDVEMEIFLNILHFPSVYCIVPANFIINLRIANGRLGWNVFFFYFFLLIERLKDS
jgi:hypothetical protein